MADTSLGFNEKGICSDCNCSGTVITHWGPITNGQVKSFCGECWKKRVDEYYGAPIKEEIKA